MTKTADEREGEVGQLLYELSKLPWEEAGELLDNALKQEREAALREAVGRLEEMAHTEPQIIYDDVRFISLPEAKRALLDGGAE